MIMSGIAPNFNSNSNSAHDYSAHDYSRYPKISRSACDPIQARMSGDAPRRVPLSSVHVSAKYDVSMLFHFTANFGTSLSGVYSYGIRQPYCQQFILKITTRDKLK